MKLLKRIIIFVVLAGLLGGVSGCGQAPQPLRYDIPYNIQTLDPQFVADGDAAMIVAHLYEGLFRQMPDGAIVPGVAESFTVSPDGRVYEFTLRKDAAWSNGDPVVADDFVFGIQRLFHSAGVSSYATDYLCIQNARDILAGHTDYWELGVEAVTDSLLRITLDTANPFFIQLLSRPAAMPCNRKFFATTRARYGMEKTTVLTNGPFSLQKWTPDKSIIIEPNPHYYDPAAVGPPSVYFYIGREDPAALFADDRSDGLEVDLAAAQTLENEGYGIQRYTTTTWVLVFNQNGNVLVDRDMRYALQTAIDREKLGPLLEPGHTLTESVLPPATMLFDRSYRTMGGDVIVPNFNPEAAKTIYRARLKELGRTDWQTMILFPESEPLDQYLSLIRQMWQQNLGFSVGLEEVPQADFQKRIQQGDYSVALVPLTGDLYSPLGILRQFATGDNQNHWGYSRSAFDDLLLSAANAATLDEAANDYVQAEDRLLEDAVVVPLFTQDSFFATGPEVTGLVLSPAAGWPWFKDARRK